jgi:hypothetical protein
MRYNATETQKKRGMRCRDSACKPFRDMKVGTFVVIFPLEELEVRYVPNCSHVYPRNGFRKITGFLP